MQAVICDAFGPPSKLRLGELAAPKLGASGVRIRVAAAGLNFPDALIVEGRYQFQPERPFSPGGEVAGEVVEVGDRCQRVKVGDRVMALTGWGGFAEEVVTAESNTIPVPAGLSLQQAAGFTMIYGTSMHALTQRAALSEGETLLVLGAGGGVGKAAVEIGKALGARVIAAASSSEKLDLAQASGADELINYGESDLRAELKRLTGGQGVDVAYDPIGGDRSETALRSMNWNGRLLIVGFASGTIPSLPANLALLKGCQICGVFWGAFAQRFPEENRQNFQRLASWLEEGQISPVINRVYPFEEAPQAIADIGERRVVGKAVVNVDPDLGS